MFVGYTSSSHHVYCSVYLLFVGSQSSGLDATVYIFQGPSQLFITCSTEKWEEQSHVNMSMTELTNSHLIQKGDVLHTSTRTIQSTTH